MSEKLKRMQLNRMPLIAALTDEAIDYIVATELENIYLTSEDSKIRKACARLLDYVTPPEELTPDKRIKWYEVGQ